MRLVRFPILLVCAGLGACSMFGKSDPSLAEARCRAAGASAELGQPLNDRTKELARMGAGAARAAVVPYGVPVRQPDVDPQRLNIEVDQQQVIQRLRCG
jgi:hypothetical protein